MNHKQNKETLIWINYNQNIGHERQKEHLMYSQSEKTDFWPRNDKSGDCDRLLLNGYTGNQKMVES